jgi:hypothetical protein
MATDLPMASDLSRQPPCGSNTVRLALRRAWLVRKCVAVFVVEIALAALSYALAVCIIQEEEGKQWALRILAQTLPYLLAFRLASLFCFGLFKRSFRYASIPDLISVSKAVSLSTLLYLAVVRNWLTDLHLPFVLFILDWALLQFLGISIDRSRCTPWSEIHPKADRGPPVRSDHRTRGTAARSPSTRSSSYPAFAAPRGSASSLVRRSPVGRPDSRASSVSS